MGTRLFLLLSILSMACLLLAPASAVAQAGDPPPVPDTMSFEEYLSFVWHEMTGEWVEFTVLYAGETVGPSGDLTRYIVVTDSNGHFHVLYVGDFNALFTENVDDAEAIVLDDMWGSVGNHITDYWCLTTGTCDADDPAWWPNWVWMPDVEPPPGIVPDRDGDGIPDILDPDDDNDGVADDEDDEDVTPTTGPTDTQATPEPTTPAGTPPATPPGTPPLTPPGTPPPVTPPAPPPPATPPATPPAPPPATPPVPPPPPPPPSTPEPPGVPPGPPVVPAPPSGPPFMQIDFGTEVRNAVVVGQDAEERGADIYLTVRVPPVVYTYELEERQQKCIYSATPPADWDGCDLDENGDGNPDHPGDPNWDEAGSTTWVLHYDAVADPLVLTPTSAWEFRAELTAESRAWILGELRTHYPNAVIVQSEWDLTQTDYFELTANTIDAQQRAIVRMQATCVPFVDPGVYDVIARFRTRGTRFVCPGTCRNVRADVGGQIIWADRTPPRILEAHKDLKVWMHDARLVQ